MSCAIKSRYGEPIELRVKICCRGGRLCNAINLRYKMNQKLDCRFTITGKAKTKATGLLRRCAPRKDDKCLSRLCGLAKGGSFWSDSDEAIQQTYAMSYKKLE